MNPTVIRMGLRLGQRGLAMLKQARDKKASEFYEELHELAEQAKKRTGVVADSGKDVAAAARDRVAEVSSSSADALDSWAKEAKKAAGQAAASSKDAAARVTTLAADATDTASKKARTAGKAASKKARKAQKKAAKKLRRDKKRAGLARTLISVLAILVGVVVTAVWAITQKNKRDVVNFPPCNPDGAQPFADRPDTPEQSDTDADATPADEASPKHALDDETDAEQPGPKHAL